MAITTKPIRLYVRPLAYYLLLALLGRAHAQAPPVTLAPNGGMFALFVDVALSTPSPGGVIIYTLDGSTPLAANAFAYVAPVHITANCWLRAAVLATDGSISPVSEAQFIIQVAGPAPPPPGPMVTVVVPINDAAAGKQTITLPARPLPNTIRVVRNGSEYTEHYDYRISPDGRMVTFFAPVSKGDLLKVHCTY